MLSGVSLDRGRGALLWRLLAVFITSVVFAMDRSLDIRGFFWDADLNCSDYWPVSVFK